MKVSFWKQTRFVKICAFSFGFFIFCGFMKLHACSTFLFHQGGHLVVAHNLDQEFHTPGSIFVNLRGQQKRSVSSQELGLTDYSTPVLSWTSRYGSITFSILGAEFPDGGINQAGLVINEMALPASQFPFSSSNPTMLIHQWMQYQLDNYATVDEVLLHLKDINIEPRATFSPISEANYHFFVADRLGRSAAIEFIEGEAVVYTGNSLPFPILCNAPYQSEVTRVEKYQGIFGSIKRWLNSNEDQRFLVSLERLQNDQPNIHPDVVDYCFQILSAMQFENTKQWSVVYDLSQDQIYFRTVQEPGIKSLSLKNFDFSNTGRPLVLYDLDGYKSGEVTSRFVPFTEKLNRKSIEDFLVSLTKFVTSETAIPAINGKLTENYGFTLDQFVDKANSISLSIRTEPSPAILLAPGS